MLSPLTEVLCVTRYNINYTILEYEWHGLYKSTPRIFLCFALIQYSRQHINWTDNLYNNLYQQAWKSNLMAWLSYLIKDALFIVE